nr:reverse transcriptase domain-containing protein [Tanacetum cinerariifolium]
MSTNDQTSLSQPTSVVRNTLGNGQTPHDLVRPIFDETLREYYDENSHQILPIIAEKVHQEKHIQEIQRIGHTITAVETPKAATRVLAPEKQKLLSRNIVTKENPHEERKHCQKVKASQVDIESQNQRSKSKSFRTTCPNHRETARSQKKAKPQEGKLPNQQRTKRKQDRFTILTKTPKEILALEKWKFKPHQPMTTSVEKRNTRKFCEFHGEVWHTIEECMHLKRKIKEMVKEKKLSHLIKELKCQKPNDPYNNTTGGVQRRNNMAEGADIIAGENRKAKGKENSGHATHGLQNAKVPSDKKNGHIAK